MTEIVRCAAGPGGGGVRVERRDGRSKVIDIHCHFHAAAGDAVLRPYVAEAAPELLARVSSPASDAVNRTQMRQLAGKLTSIDQRISEMDALGIDIQVISPVPGQQVYVAPAEAAREASRLINDAIAEAVAAHPDRLRGMGVVPLQVPELAIAELARCVDDLGMRGIEIPTHVAGRELSEPELRPFFAAAHERGVLLFMHPLGFTHGQRLREHYFNNVLGNPIQFHALLGLRRALVQRGRVWLGSRGGREGTRPSLRDGSHAAVESVPRRSLGVSRG